MHACIHTHNHTYTHTHTHTHTTHAGPLHTRPHAPSASAPPGAKPETARFGTSGLRRRQGVLQERRRWMGGGGAGGRESAGGAGVCGFDVAVVSE